jgi:hypothetical protein
MVSAAVVFILGDKTPVVEVATVREDRGERSALLNASCGAWKHCEHVNW